MSSGVGWVEAEGTEGKAQETGRSSPRERERLEVRTRVVVMRPLERGEERRQGRLMEMSRRNGGRRHHGEWLTSLSNVDTLSGDGGLPTGVAHLPVAPVTGRCEREIHSRTMDHLGTVAHC
jgi:hypothetical protein